MNFLPTLRRELFLRRVFSTAQILRRPRAKKEEEDIDWEEETYKMQEIIIKNLKIALKDSRSYIKTERKRSAVLQVYFI